MVESINKILTKMSKDEVFKIEENEKIIDIVERILELNREKQLDNQGQD